MSTVKTSVLDESRAEARTVLDQRRGQRDLVQASSASAQPNADRAHSAPTNGAKAVDFVSEDDVRRAIQKGEKIYVNAKTIITPAARDIGEPAEVFAKV